MSWYAISTRSNAHDQPQHAMAYQGMSWRLVECFMANHATTATASPKASATVTPRQSPRHAPASPPACFKSQGTPCQVHGKLHDNLHGKSHDNFLHGNIHDKPRRLVRLGPFAVACHGLTVACSLFEPTFIHIPSYFFV